MQRHQSSSYMQQLLHSLNSHSTPVQNIPHTNQFSSCDQQKRAPIYPKHQSITHQLNLLAQPPDWAIHTQPPQFALFEYFIQQSYLQILQSIRSNDSFQIHSALASALHLLADQSDVHGILPLAYFRIFNIQEDFLQNQNIPTLQNNILIWFADLQKLLLHHAQNYSTF